MPVKILSRAGVSLADTYDVQGSIAGVEELDSESVKVVHEMGSTIFAERFSQTIRRVSSGDLAQNITVGFSLTDLPDTASRINGLTLLANPGSRTTRMAVMVTDPLAGREVVIFNWDGTNEDSILMDDDGSVVNQGVLRADPTYTLLPNMLSGTGAPQSVSDINVRGLTSGFGAGTVEYVLLLHISLASDGSGLSSRGLPLPSW